MSSHKVTTIEIRMVFLLASQLYGSLSGKVEYSIPGSISAECLLCSAVEEEEDATSQAQEKKAKIKVVYHR